ncbi:hypothetical protein MM239_01885 [Belliella sp. DSM 111904]|uniref:RNA polymerase alpha subunit C-terminal domain-containing protein n=1 Tax=Belliella filtrata TaxID=2923435 RepID=A0ABS9UVD7_9BACT|nr:hypothetical protein [Belliella filtrata]MCH7408131.1 hypothetical protein [Belliella filtrata]
MQKLTSNPLSTTLLDDEKYDIVHSNTEDKENFQFERYKHGVFDYSFYKDLPWGSKKTTQEPLCMISFIPIAGFKLNRLHSLAGLKQRSQELFICDRINWKKAKPQHKHLSKSWDEPGFNFLSDQLNVNYYYSLKFAISCLGSDGKRLSLGIPNNGSQITLGDLVKLLSFTAPKELLEFRNVGPKKAAYLYSLLTDAGISLDEKNYL